MLHVSFFLFLFVAFFDVWIDQRRKRHKKVFVNNKTANNIFKKERVVVVAKEVCNKYVMEFSLSELLQINLA